MDIGQRIRQARLAQGTTMRQLAKKVGVSAAAISKYESGKNVPRPSILLKLARELQVKMSFLTRDVTISLAQPAFRKDRTLSERTQKAVIAKIMDDLEKYETVESLFPQDRWTLFEVGLNKVESIEDAENAAESLRELWKLGVGPIGDLTGCLEDRGVRVFKLTSVPRFDGFSCLMNDRVPVIAYSADIPGDRQRFTMAHELGHLILDVADVLDKEKAANRFAGALLLPRATLLTKLGRSRSQLSLQELSLLKQKYGLNMQSISRRAHELGIIDEKTYKTIRQLFRRNGWTEREPGDQIASEQPRRYSLLLLQAMAERLITPSTAADLTSYNPAKRPEVKTDSLVRAVESMVSDYRNDKELIAFTLLNTEDLVDENERSRPR